MASEVMSQRLFPCHVFCRSLLKPSGPLPASCTSLTSDSGGKQWVQPCEPPSSACSAPSLPSLPYCSWLRATCNMTNSVWRYKTQYILKHDKLRWTHYSSASLLSFSRLRCRSCFEWSTARFSMSRSQPAEKEGTSLRIWSSTEKRKLSLFCFLTRMLQLSFYC